MDVLLSLVTRIAAVWQSRFGLVSYRWGVAEFEYRVFLCFSPCSSIGNRETELLDGTMLLWIQV